MLLVLKQPYRSDKWTEERTFKAFARYTKGDAIIAELFDPKDIFTRDKWHCKSCGKPTRKSLYGKNSDDAPTLDHIIPRTLGGAHTMQNTQLLCRKCNYDKNRAQQLASLGKGAAKNKCNTISAVRLYVYEIILSRMIRIYGGFCSDVVGRSKR
jgi:hypothetical protein